MKKITEKSIAILTIISIWFVILFDPTNLAIGTKLLTLPDFVLGLAEIFGNLIWLLGVLFFILASWFVFIIVNEDEIKKITKDAVERTSKHSITPHTIIDKNGNLMFPQRPLQTRVFLLINTICSFIAIGSGFWFTGTGWLLLIITSHVYRKVAVVIAEDLIKEKLEKNDE